MQFVYLVGRDQIVRSLKTMINTYKIFEILAIKTRMLI